VQSEEEGREDPYDVRKCANDCRVSACTTSNGEISKLKKAPCDGDSRNVGDGVDKYARFTWKPCTTVGDMYALSVSTLLTFG
jgi:hypothetical protein